MDSLNSLPPPSWPIAVGGALTAMHPRTVEQASSTNIELVLLGLTIHEVPYVLGALLKDDVRLTEDSLGPPSPSSPLPHGTIEPV